MLCALGRIPRMFCQLVLYLSPSAHLVSCVLLSSLAVSLPTSCIHSPCSPLPALHEAYKRLQWMQCSPSILCTAASPESQVSPGDSGTDPCGLCLVSHHYTLSFPPHTPSVSNIIHCAVFITEHVHTYKTDIIT